MYVSRNIIRVIKSRKIWWTEHVACMGEMRYAYKILVGKPEGKRPCGIPMHSWEDNIRMDLREIVWEIVDWNRLAQNRDRWQPLVNRVLNLVVP